LIGKGTASLSNSKTLEWGDPHRHHTNYHRNGNEKKAEKEEEDKVDDGDTKTDGKSK
jgi:hypothetical protein